MVDDLGMVLLEDLLHSGLVLDVGNDKYHPVDKFVVRLSVAEFELEVVHGRLGLVHHDDFFRLVLGQLATDFTTDGACGSGDHDNFVDHLADDVDVVQFDALALQKVLDFDVLDLIDSEGCIYPFTDMGD